MKKAITTNSILWAVYLALLAVLLPHTAWLFGQFEPISYLGTGAAWAGAFAFECAIAVLTHKLAKHIEATSKRKNEWQKFTYRYLNAYSFGLVVTISVSSLANLAHAVEFGRGLAIFAKWGIPAEVYQFAFGAILPVVSLLFARVLSNVVETEEQADPELDKAKEEIAYLRGQLKLANKAIEEANNKWTTAENELGVAEARFEAAGELFARLFAAEKKQRILTAKSQWPGLAPSAIAIITETSPAYVSEVLNSVSVETVG